MAQRPVTPKQLALLAKFDRFLETELGCYPASIAAIKLRMTPQGVFQAAERGWIKYFSIGRNRMYSRKDVIRYRFEVSKKFDDTRVLPYPAPLDMST